MRCLCCHQTFYSLPSWANVLFLQDEEHVCSECEQQLLPLDEKDQCVSCSRSLSRLRSEFRKGKQCLDCWRWEQAGETKGLLEKNVSLYEYNPFIKEWLTVYKFRGDAIVATYFSKKLLAVYRKHYFGHLVIPIPLSAERLMARGFNQAQLLIENWRNSADVLSRIEGEKQSKKIERRE
ncbi:ComF family protein [Bacillus sp. JCM 19034]|uniref:ComF family protein n=1 Tax=Bacillus sp. JCM 19034 TaxID=1481928 RepID=UPI000784C125|nr:ComF family protein [Bacillus sp. JCM 19034]